MGALDFRQITLTAVPGIPLIRPGGDLATIILERLAAAGMQLRDGDVVVIAQKVVSKAEGRLVHLAEVVPSPRAREVAAQVEKDARLVELILREARDISRMRPGLLIVEHRLGFICANAGIDRSNVAPDGEQEWVTLLPEDPDASARRIRRRLMEATGCDVAVIIADSHGRPWRVGAVGVAIGVAGMAPVEDLRGQKDLFGHELQTTQVGLADQLAAAASLVMGQANEGCPVVVVRGVGYTAREDASAREILRPREQDLYR